MQVVLLTEGSDLDSLSSAYALTLLEKDTYIFLPNSYSASVKLTLQLYAKKFKEKILKKEKLKDVTKVFIVDTSSSKKITQILQEAGLKSVAKIVVIDHHENLNSIKGKNIKKISVNYGACTTYFIKKIKRKKIPIDKDDATILALGIYEDTGSFTYDNTTEEDLKSAAFLIKSGVNFDALNQILSKKIDEKTLKILEQAVKNLQILFIKDKKIGISTIFCKEYIPDISNYLNQLKELNNLNAFFLIIVANRKLFIIARSKDIDVASILSFFGGGGHKKAAAATLKDVDYKEVANEIESLIIKNIYINKTIKDFAIKDYTAFDENVEIKQLKDIKEYFIFTLDKEGNYKGIVLAKTIKNALRLNLKNIKLKDIAIEDLYTFNLDTPIHEAEKIALNSSQDIFPILDKGKIYGYVTKRSLIGSIHLDAFQKEEDIFISRRRLIPKQVNVKSKLENYFPKNIQNLLQEIGKTARDLNMRAYLVGGIVRDIIMGRENLDIDIIVEGDAIELAKVYSKKKNLKFNKFEEFMTAQIKINNLKIDFATARKEVYSHPGAYPKVEKASLREDLYRRDFTINTLAIDITQDSFGVLIDYFTGINDIKNKKIRILHQLSFIEDPIRILRALRFAGRFDFTLGKATDKLLKVAVNQNLVNAAPEGRINLELNLTFNESKVVEILRLMSEYRVIHQIIPFFELTEEKLKLLERLRENILFFKETFNYSLNKSSLYLLALMVHLPLEVSYKVLEKYFFHNQFKIFEEFFSVKDKIPKLKKNSDIFNILSSLNKETIVFITSYYTPDVAEKIIEILKKSQKNILTGKDLINLGLKPSKEFSQIIDHVKKLYLDNKIKTKQEALEYVKEKFL